MNIQRGDSLVMILKDNKILLGKSDEIALILDEQFNDIKSISERELEKLWLNEYDEQWNKYAEMK
jgi:hypothetical protein